MPPGKAKETTHAPQETPSAKAVDKATPTTARDASVAVDSKTEAAVDKSHADENTNGAVGNKRRGIRLKQDLD
jgi:hypothetical protein